VLLCDVTTTIEYGTSPGLRAIDGPARSVPVVVIGAGQAGRAAVGANRAGRGAAIALLKLLART
jgi:hypothetical protein